ncbi:kalirin isoform X2 [Drosophila grimshawi]|uniref:kalirin isoform X2 n=1 Tax=Drosophila grimshawi TaxID=7222 RepID=UPI000C86FE19|nr:kalirin isoform X2 [Drosophila grimshawi]
MFAINWFDVLPVAITFVAIFLVQVLNVYFHILSDTATPRNADIVDTVTAETECPLPFNGGATTPKITNKNGSISPTISNGKLEKQTSLLDTDSHEDEDTLSLENLFPCDQTEIYASKKISFIIDELIQTEVNYVNNLRKGLTNYGQLHQCEDLPEGLGGDQRQKQLLSNIREILELHETEILPLMLRNQRDLKGLFDEFATHFEKNRFYCYVDFTMGKKQSMQLRQENREWLQSYQTKIKDKLGIDSFLVQPIQRLTRYPLLLQQFISEFYKTGISCKPVLSAVCKLETRMRRQLDVVNQAEEIHNIDELNEFDLQQQGNFRRSTEFDAQYFPTRKKYRAKIFLFDRCLVCTEVRKRRLAFRQHYNWEHVELQRPLELATSNANKTINLLIRQQDKDKPKREEYSFVAAEASVVKQWLLATHKIIEIARYEQSQRNTFSLPMDLVLGVVLAIWLIWQYL